MDSGEALEPEEFAGEVKVLLPRLERLPAVLAVGEVASVGLSVGANSNVNADCLSIMFSF